MKIWQDEQGRFWARRYGGAGGIEVFVTEISASSFWKLFSEFARQKAERTQTCEVVCPKED